MTNYEKPMVLTNEDLSESVYTASGNCWTGEVVSTQDYVDGKHIFEVRMWHSREAVHITNHVEVYLTFNNAISSITAEADFEASCSGTNAIVTRTLHANGYKSGDSATFKIWVGTGDQATTSALACIGINFNCTHMENVQGGID